MRTFLPNLCCFQASQSAHVVGAFDVACVTFLTCQCKLPAAIDLNLLAKLPHFALLFCICLFLFVSQVACCLFVCLFVFYVSLFIGLHVCLFVCLLAGWLVVHHDLFSQNNSDCHLHKETLVCSKFEVGLMKILSLACNLAFYNCLVVPSSSDQKCLVVPSLRSRSTIPFVS